MRDCKIRCFPANKWESVKCGVGHGSAPYFVLRGLNIEVDLKLYTIKNEYVNYLRADSKLKNVFENKDEEGRFLRKYLGVVLSIENYSYYVPLSSPKDSDYLIKEGRRVIRPSVIPIIRMISIDVNGKRELKGTLKFSNMIPVPNDVITYYDISQEVNKDYKILVEKEYEFIKKNRSQIVKNAFVLYNQKTKESLFYTDGKKKPGYLKNVVDFKYAEQKYNQYKNENSRV